MSTEFNLSLYFQEWEKYAEEVMRVNQNNNFHYIKIGEDIILLNFSNKRLENKLFPPLSHLETGPTHQQSLSATINFIDSSTTKLVCPSIPNTRKSVAESRPVSASHEGEYLFYEPQLEKLKLYSTRKKVGIFWKPDCKKIQPWETSCSMQDFLYWIYLDANMQTIHAGAVGNESGACILAGRSGAGKSTTSLKSLEIPNFSFYGDDYIFIDVEKNIVYTLYSCGKLHFDSEFHKELKTLGSALSTEDEDKFLIPLHNAFRNKIGASKKISSILVLKQTGKKISEIVPCEKIDAFRAIMHNAMYSFSEKQKGAKKILKFINSLPTYSLLLGTDLNDTYKKINMHLKIICLT